MGKIILSGYMGSGKSTIAKLLEHKIGLKSFDLDTLIEEKAQLTINEIFLKKGELQFRKMEHDTLRELLMSDGNLILSLGGGTPCYFNNANLLKQEGITTIYLKASINTLFERLVVSNADRPLLSGKSPEDIKEFIAKHLFERNSYYTQADHTIITDAVSPEEVAERIIQILA